MIETRALVPDDWQLWRVMRLAALADAPHAFRSSYAYWSTDGDNEGAWRARLSAVPLNIVLNWQGEPAGIVSADAPADRDTVELTSMWVAPRARGSGVGDAAIQTVLDWAERHYPQRPVELSVKETNTAAIVLYRRHGFVERGSLPDLPDELLMRRDG